METIELTKKQLQKLLVNLESSFVTHIRIVNAYENALSEANIEVEETEDEYGKYNLDEDIDDFIIDTVANIVKLINLGATPQDTRCYNIILETLGDSCEAYNIKAEEYDKFVTILNENGIK